MEKQYYVLFLLVILQTRTYDAVDIYYDTATCRWNVSGYDLGVLSSTAKSLGTAIDVILMAHCALVQYY